MKSNTIVMQMRVLIGYDGSESADAALDDLQKAGLPRELKALIVSVGEVVMPPSLIGSEVAGMPVTPQSVKMALAQADAQTAQSLEEAEELAGKAAARVRSYFPDWDVRTVGISGWPATELIQQADGWNADLVVVGSQGRSALGRFILGSVSKKVVTDSLHSVRVSRAAVEKNIGNTPRVIIGVDGSPEAEHAVRVVGTRVWPLATDVRIITVDDGTSPARISPVLPTAAAMIRSINETAAEAARMMTEWAANELRAIGLQVSVAIKKGAPGRVIIEEALQWKADSIFVGSRKFSGALERFWLGSVSTELVTNAHCSVEVVRSATD
ncbi:MAG TPA: universal stress protein [Pyrinomonadaceae bacterium]|nr:universal stress protein [Pyrinomonadaceae bacterium]